jgi:hypothetical protein
VRSYLRSGRRRDALSGDERRKFLHDARTSSGTQSASLSRFRTARSIRELIPPNRTEEVMRRRLFHGRAGIALPFTLGLVIATAATATAAKLITGKQIKNGSVGLVDLSAKAKKSLRGARGRRGPQGPAGPQGAPGGAAATLWFSNLDGNARGAGFVRIDVPADRLAGSHVVTFTQDVSRCAFVATTGAPGFAYASAEQQFNGTKTGQVFVGTFDSAGNNASRPFSLAVYC